MTKDLDKIELRSTAPEVKESLSTPVTELAKATESLVGLLQKINDLGDASKAIAHAETLYKSGEVGKAKELVGGIFRRLKQIGRAPEGLDIAKVQKRLSEGNYAKLAEEIKGVKDGGVAAKLKEPENLIKRISEVKKDRPLDTVQKLNNATINEKLITDIDSEVATEKKKIDIEEVKVQKEFTKLLDLVEKSAILDEQKEFETLRANIEAGLVGEIDIKKHIGKLREEIQLKVEAKVVRDVSSRETSDNEMAEELKKGDIKSAKKGLVEKIKHSIKGDQIFTSRLQKLVVGMDKVEKDIERGIGLQEAVRSLAPDQIREVRAILSSLGEVVDETERSPYYDPQYVDFVESLNLQTEEIIGLRKTLEIIDVEYQRESLTSPASRAGEAVSRRRRGEPEPALDEDGRVLGGMELGLMGEDERRDEYEKGVKQFNELFTPTSDGGFVERSMESQLIAKLSDAERYAYSKLEQRESFLNINMKELFDYIKKVDTKRLDNFKGKPEDFTRYYDVIDHEYYREHGVAKLEDRFMSPAEGSKEQAEKAEFEMWWYQEASFNQRGLAYEGLFEKRNQSLRMQRLNSLMEIVGVSTSKKGLANWMSMSYGTIDQQNNSYVNAEFMGKLATFWTNQGVDFRLEDGLKQYREEIGLAKDGMRQNILDAEGNVVSISVMDTVRFMEQHITDPELRAKLGIPTWWKGKVGTMIYKYSESGKRDETRRIIWDHFMEKELGAIIKGEEKIGDADQKDIYNRYSLMFDLGFQYHVVHKSLNTMIGNASFEKGDIELPAACAEMHIKLDPLAYPKLFVPRFQFLGAQLKEAFSLYEIGVRDHVTMAPQDYASLYTETSIGKGGEFRKNTNNGAPTIGATFLGERTDADALVAETEIHEIFNGVYKKDKKGKKTSKLIKEGALWHWGIKPGEGVGNATDIYLQLGVYGDQKSSYRRSAGEITKKLLENTPSKPTLEMMNWDRYFDIVKNPRVKRLIEAQKTPEGKWRAFAETFGEHSFHHATASAKRSADQPIKYGVENVIKYQETFLTFAEDYANPEKFDALLNVPTAVNNGIVPGIATRNLKFVIEISEVMGKKWLGGGSTERFERDEKNNTIKVDTSYGLNGVGDNEWPSIKTETIWNDKAPWNPIQHKNTPGSVGVGYQVDKQLFLDLIKAERAKGRLPDEIFSHLYKEIVNSGWYEPKLGFIVNAYNFVRMESLFEWLGPQLGISGHELRHIITENTEKTTEKFLHYLNGGGGH